MTTTTSAQVTTLARGASGAAPAPARAVLLLTVGAALAAGFLPTGGDAAAQVGSELARLLRAMAVLKALMVAGMTAAVFWRLGAAVTSARLAGYSLACAVMAGGVGLIWQLAHVVAGALLVHGGLIAGALLLWRDPVVGMRLSAMVAARRGARPGFGIGP
jgi:hypothetical protein